MRSKALFSLIALSTILLVSCTNISIAPRAIDKPPDFSIYSRAPYVSVDNVPLDESKRIPITAQHSAVRFIGPVNLSVPTKPLIEVDREKAKKNVVTACIATLPVCPLTLLLLANVLGTHQTIEATCHATLLFEPTEGQSYVVKLQETDGILPILRILLLSNKSVVTEKLLSCDGIEEYIK